MESHISPHANLTKTEENTQNCYNKLILFIIVCQTLIQEKYHDQNKSCSIREFKKEKEWLERINKET